MDKTCLFVLYKASPAPMKVKKAGAHIPQKAVFDTLPDFPLFS